MAQPWSSGWWVRSSSSGLLISAGFFWLLLVEVGIRGKETSTVMMHSDWTDVNDIERYWDVSDWSMNVCYLFCISWGSEGKGGWPEGSWKLNWRNSGLMAVGHISYCLCSGRTEHDEQIARWIGLRRLQRIKRAEGRKNTSVEVLRAQLKKEGGRGGEGLQRQ